MSVIIPTLNEAAFLPDLLEALDTQTRAPDEIIVADAGSVDGTPELATAHGARVIRGGRPAAGRNAGARVASGEVFLFFDADVKPSTSFIQRALDEFTRAGYAAAACLVEPLSEDITAHVIVEACNLFFQVMRSISPHASGFCIFAQRRVHEAMGGFDESLTLSEDLDYARRASQYGEFGVLTSVRIGVSMRRLEEEGLVQLALKYLWCEIFALAGKPVRSQPFEYKFGAHQPAVTAASRPIIDIAKLRKKLGKFENPALGLSQGGLDTFRHLVERDSLGATRERLDQLLKTRDLNILDRYLERRLTLGRKEIKSFKKQIARVKKLPKESVHLLETNWQRTSRPRDISSENDGRDS